MIRVQCPAKVNLFLEVTGRRPDGYHRLATLFAKINLYDVLELEAAPRGVALEIDSDAPLSAGPDNLVCRAAQAFIKAFRVDGGARLRLVKRIPMGAGLGGGSSDAAGTLLGLAKIFSVRLDAGRKARLARLAAALGADVPFFLHPAPFCLGTGIGDRLKPVRISKSLPYMVLVYPGLHVSTVEAYRALPLPLPSRSVVLTRLSQLDRLIRSLQRGRPVEEWEGLLFNRLESAELPVLEQVEAARRVLLRLGVRGARMSGSGSSVFGFVASHSEGQAALERLRGYSWKGFLTSCAG
ncbi:MAG: 4-(cytidine 5'-diphospho)-2-C-methyl-D-erythritol kinase [Elusimicrobia bacterium]|nr:4-(cytidine 5'-diphospho)-2-C-methyl-D-erythritol kinase [Elusimicrobiota bacterium]